MDPETKLNRALELRQPLRANGTDMLRLVDGAGDDLDGIEIDDFANRWLVQTRAGDFADWLRNTPGPQSIYWKRLGEEKSAPEWVTGDKINEPFIAIENGIKFRIDFAAGYSQGIFLDQRDNRLEIRRRSAGKRVLNCFAYTSGFGLAAALGGGETVNLDLSKRYLDWGRTNYELNGLDPTQHDFIYGDTFNWLERFAKKARKFDLIILDPPTFSRDKNGKVFTIETGFSALVKSAAAVLDPGGVLFCSTNQRNLFARSFRTLIEKGLEKPPAWKFNERPMPKDFTGDKYLKSFWLAQR